MKRFLLTCLIFTLSPAYSYAQASQINEQGAQTLKSSFQAMLNYQKKLNNAFGGVDLTYEGELTVKQEETYYTITLPRILIKESNPSEDSKNEIFDIGTIVINAMPDDKANYWKTVMTFPSEMTLSSGDEKLFSISFGEQRSIGLYNDKLGYFTKMDANLSDIRLFLAKEDVGISLGGAQMYMNFEEDENAKFSGPSHLLLSNMTVASPEAGEQVSFGELKIDFSWDKVNLPTLAEYEAKILKHADTFEALQNVNPDDAEAAAANSQAIMDMLFDLYDFEMSGFTVNYLAKDIKVSSEDKAEDNFELSSGNLGMALSGLGTEKGMFRFSTGYAGLVPPQNNAGAKDILPAELDFDIRAENIPYASLWQITQSTMNAVIQDPENVQMAGLGVIMRLPAVLGQAGTQLVIEKNGVKNHIYDVSLDGKVATDLASLMGFTAKFTSIFEGMDDLIAKLEPENPEENTAMPQTELLKNLEQWKSVGKQTTGPNGKPAYQFDLETTPEGQILINGQDASAIMADPQPTEVMPLEETP